MLKQFLSDDSGFVDLIATIAASAVIAIFLSTAVILAARVITTKMQLDRLAENTAANWLKSGRQGPTVVRWADSSVALKYYGNASGCYPVTVTTSLTLNVLSNSLFKLPSWKINVTGQASLRQQAYSIPDNKGLNCDSQGPIPGS